MADLSILWEQLSIEGEHGDGYVRLRVPSIKVTTLYAARRISSGIEGLILEVSTEAIQTSFPLPRSAGFELISEPISIGRHGRTRFVLALTDHRFKDVFRSLCHDVSSSLSSVANETEAVQSFVSRLLRWQHFLKKFGPEGLSLEQRRGLYGELVFLRDLISRCGSPAAVRAWRGSAGADHDFQLPSGSAEIKTTAANTPHSVRISNVGQLDDTGIPRLFLHLIIVDESEGGVESLPDLIQSLRIQIGDEDAEIFDEFLIQAGYIEAHANLYMSPRYSIHNRLSYRVIDGFPRLRATDLPQGVEAVTYSVAVAAFKDFECDHSTLFDELLSTRSDLTS